MFCTCFAHAFPLLCLALSFSRYCFDVPCRAFPSSALASPLSCPGFSLALLLRCPSPCSCPCPGLLRPCLAMPCLVRYYLFLPVLSLALSYFGNYWNILHILRDNKQYYNCHVYFIILLPTTLESWIDVLGRLLHFLLYLPSVIQIFIFGLLIPDFPRRLFRTLEYIILYFHYLHYGVVNIYGKTGPGNFGWAKTFLVTCCMGPKLFEERIWTGPNFFRAPINNGAFTF